MTRAPHMSTTGAVRAERWSPHVDEERSGTHAPATPLSQAWREGLTSTYRRRGGSPRMLGR
jgi:hypothetical protein